MKGIFNTCDSFAYWDIPNEIMNNNDKVTLFKETYKSNYFPEEMLPDNLDKLLSEMKYVIVGLNPGKKGISQEEKYLNFHGNKNSLDYRNAAVFYDTPLWGAFMTDLVHKPGDSSKVKPTKKDVEQLDRHLDSLGISDKVTLIALGTIAYDALSEYSKRSVKRIDLHSNINGHWTYDRVSKQVKEATKR